jgi:hypothetical protein
MLARSDAALMLVLVMVLVVVFSIQPFTTFAQTCTGSRRPIQEGDIERAAKLGITIEPGTPCVDQNILGNALDANTEQDIAYLSKKTCPGFVYGFPAGFSQADTSPENWDPIRNGHVYFTGGGTSMNPGALKCFREFFEAAEQRGLQPCIRAALRSPAHQRSSCRAPENSVVCGRSGRGTGGASSCSSNLSSYLNCPHVNGLAFDVDDKGGRLSSLLGLARSSGKFSKVGAGAADPWHIEAAGCAAGGFNTNPDLKDSWSAPSAGLTDNFRQAFGLPTQQAQPVVAQPAHASQPVSISQSPLSAFEETNTNADAGVSSQITGDTGASSGSSTAADRLEDLAFGPKATSTQSATSVPLVVSGANAATLSGTQNASTTSVIASHGVISPSQTTFISGDLSWQGSGAVAHQPLSGVEAILVTIKATLIRMLQYLTPFGIRAADTYGESGE